MGKPFIYAGPGGDFGVCKLGVFAVFHKNYTIRSWRCLLLHSRLGNVVFGMNKLLPSAS